MTPPLISKDLEESSGISYSLTDWVSAVYNITPHAHSTQLSLLVTVATICSTLPVTFPVAARLPSLSTSSLRKFGPFLDCVVMIASVMSSPTPPRPWEGMLLKLESSLQKIIFVFTVYVY